MARLNIGAAPFVRWNGTKSQHLHILEQALPADFASLNDVTYIEPFVGGGAMLFHMLQSWPNITRVVINDSNLDLMRAYNTVRDRSSELIQELKYMQKEFLTLSSDGRADYFAAARAEFDSRLCDGLRHSALFIFLNKASLSSEKYRPVSRPVICEEELLRADSHVLQRVTILCDDYEKTYNEAQGNTFFFLDPPCRPVGRDHVGEWNDQDQVRLKKFCDLLNFRHFTWMLTGSDGRTAASGDDFMDRLYGNYDIQRIWSDKNRLAAPAKRQKTSELLVRNFNREILSLRDLRCTQLSLAF